jgi:hypothetical protein
MTFLSIPLKQPSWFGSSSIDTTQFSKAKSYADVSTVWDQMVDFFCGTKREAAKQAFFTLTHTTEDSLGRMKAYQTLLALVPDDIKGQFKVKRTEDSGVAEWEFCFNDEAFTTITASDPSHVAHIKAYELLEPILLNEIPEEKKEAANRALDKLMTQKIGSLQYCAYQELLDNVALNSQQQFNCTKKEAIGEDNTWLISITGTGFATIILPSGVKPDEIKVTSLRESEQGREDFYKQENNVANNLWGGDTVIAALEDTDSPTWFRKNSSKLNEYTVPWW